MEEIWDGSHRVENPGRSFDDNYHMPLEGEVVDLVHIDQEIEKCGRPNEIRMIFKQHPELCHRRVADLGWMVRIHDDVAERDCEVWVSTQLRKLFFCLGKIFRGQDSPAKEGRKTSDPPIAHCSIR
jgi:hypothetical protein